MNASDFESHYDILPDAVVIHSGGRIVYANPAACALYACSSPGEVIGKPVIDFVPPDEREGVLRRIAEVTAGGEVPLRRARLVTLDGTCVAVEVTGRRFTIGSGEPGVLVVMRDVTDRVEEQDRLRALSERATASEEALRRSERRFRHLLEYGSELIFVTDLEGTLKFVSGTAWSVLGWDPAELVGRSAFTFAHPDDIPTHMAMLRDVAQEPGRRRAVTARIRSASDGYRMFEISAINLLHDASVGGIVLNAHDVTERNRLAEAVAQMQRVESLGRVAAAMAHEFNNVLAAADAFTTVLERDHDDVNTAVAGLKKSIARGRRVTSDILGYAQVPELAPEPIDAGDWLEELRPELEALLGGRNPLHLQVDDGTPPIAGDRHRLSRAILNLAINARDASAPGQPVSIVACPVDDSLAIEVTDRGAGMPGDVLEHAFEPLFTTKHHGTGLGLALVHQIVVRHGGTVSAESAPGEGSRFRIVLPAVKREAQ